MNNHYSVDLKLFLKFYFMLPNKIIFFFQIAFKQIYKNSKFLKAKFKTELELLIWFFFEKFLCRVSNGEESLFFGDAGCFSAKDLHGT